MNNVFYQDTGSNDCINFSSHEIHTHDINSLNNELSNVSTNAHLILSLFNVCSLNANFELLKSYMSSLKQKPHLIICTETRIIE